MRNGGRRTEDGGEERRPIIGVPAALARPTETGYVHQQVGSPYTRALEEAGALTLVLPVTDQPELIREMLTIVDGIVLQGGGDIAPRLYGQEQLPMITHVDEMTDEFELELCRQAVQNDLPILAICRGIQVLNVALGGTLVQDLPTERPGTVPHRQAASRQTPSHRIYVYRGSKLAEILGREEITVNSFHHQAIDELAGGLTVSARSEDDVIEGVEAIDKEFVIGVQFHPEETTRSIPATAELFRRLVETADARRDGRPPESER